MTEYRDGQLIDAADAQNVTCPGCGEKVGLNADKAHEGVDHPDCQFRFGLSAPAPQTQYRLTINRLEVPIRTFEEDKKAKKEEAKEQQQQQQQQKQKQKEQKESKASEKESKQESKQQKQTRR